MEPSCESDFTNEEESDREGEFGDVLSYIYMYFDIF
jgi:hypothetical protein